MFFLYISRKIQLCPAVVATPTTLEGRFTSPDEEQGRLPQVFGRLGLLMMWLLLCTDGSQRAAYDTAVSAILKFQTDFV